MNGENSSPSTGSAAPAYPNYTYRRGGGSGPLINSARNGWEKKGHIRNRPSEFDIEDLHWGDYARRILRRRSCHLALALIVAIIVITQWMGSSWSRERLLQYSLRLRLGENKGYFGVNHRVEFVGIRQLVEIERWKIPGGGSSKDGKTTKRLIMIGDIHGCIDELHSLLAKLDYKPEKDHIIATGDLINKGPHSPAVVSYLMFQGASCVRGNHEDRILLAYRDLHNPSHRKTSFSEEGETSESIKKGARSDLGLASALSIEQVKYLQACPLILDLGNVPGLGRTSVVHGGLVPVVPLEKQDPSAVMNMRSIDLWSHVPSKQAAPKWRSLMDGRTRSRDGWGRSTHVPWSDLWNTYQKMDERAEKHTVVYGHDAKRGISLGDFTWGLDGNCQRGGQLAALVVSEVDDEKGKMYQREVVTVDCKDHIAKNKDE